jgi:DNA polymerase elongation subunit (family B)
MQTFYTHVARMGDNLLYRGYEDGKPVQRKIPFSPELFTPDADGGYRALDGRQLKRYSFDTMRDARDFNKSYEMVDEPMVFGTTDYVAQYLHQAFPGEVQFDPSLVHATPIDIEVDRRDGFPDPEKALWPIDSMTIRSRDNDYWVFTTLDWTAEKCELENISVTGTRYESEEAMLLAFVAWWQAEGIDIVTGWNSRGFDIVYLVNRISIILGERYAKRLSPWGKIDKGGFVVKGQERQTIEMLGVVQLDYMDMFKKFAYAYPEQESYKLDHIAYAVLGERKLSYEEYTGLHDLRDNNPQKYVDYNIKDCRLIDQLDEKLGLIDLVMQTAYRAGVNFQDTFGTTKIWDTIIYRNLADQHVVVPPRVRKYGGHFEGAYVKPVQTGLHDWVCSFDLASLYPNIIVQYNMSPETIVGIVEPGLNVKACLDGWVNETEYSITANGVGFTKKFQGFLPKIIIGYYDDRKAVKVLMVDAQQRKEALPKEDKEAHKTIDKEITRLKNAEQAIKILLNSLYGACGSEYFRYYDLRMAEAITLSGQLAILTAEKATNDILCRAAGQKDYVIAIDTDSLYLGLADIAKKCPEGMPLVDFMDSFCDQVLKPAQAVAYDQLHVKMGSFLQRMDMQREVIADRGFWTAKKKYALNMLDKSKVRYAEPKLKIMGIEAIKSSTPEIARKWLKESFKIIMDGQQDGFHEFIAAKRAEFDALDPELIGAPRGVSEVTKYTTHDGTVPKGTPQNSRAATVYNRAITEYSLQDRFPLIIDGDKIKYVHLKLPNPLRQSIIGFPEVLPRELDIIKYIDRDTQFQKTFVDPLELICTAIGWTTEPTSSLEGLFNY